MPKLFAIRQLNLPSVFIENNLDTIAICETWLKPEDSVIIGNIIPAGCSNKQVPRATKKRGGGIALLYKTGFNVRLTDTRLLPRSFEFLSAEFITSTVSRRLIALYSPHQKSTCCTFNNTSTVLPIRKTSKR